MMAIRIRVDSITLPPPPPETAPPPTDRAAPTHAPHPPPHPPPRTTHPHSPAPPPPPHQPTTAARPRATPPPHRRRARAHVLLIRRRELLPVDAQVAALNVDVGQQRVEPRASTMLRDTHVELRTLELQPIAERALH